MGISFSCPFANFGDLNSRLETILAKSLSVKEDDVRTVLRSLSFNSQDSEPSIMKPVGSKRMMLEGSLSFDGRELDTMISFKSCTSEKEDWTPTKTLENPLTPVDTQRHQAALKVQKTYKSFRTRRQLADCAVLVEQRWWKLLDFAVLKRSSISFFEIEKPETAVSRWSRARTRAAKVGKGLSKDEKARKLALQHWLEAIDPRHRYGHNLQFYYAKWLICQSRQPFFYWLDIGEGKEVNLERCPRTKLHHQCIKYLGPIEREAYEVVVEDGKFMYKQSSELIDTRGGPEDAKWIFVLSTSRMLYIAQKKKGTFQHSSFLAGGATLSAGRLVLENGTLKSVWPHSGHYLPTEENFEAFISFLEEHNVDLKTVQKSPEDGEEQVPIQKSSGFGMRNSISEPDFTRAGEGTNEKKSHKQKSVSRKEYSKDTDNMGRPPLSRWSRGLESKITTLEIPKKENIFKIFAMEEQNTDPGSSSDGYETAEEFLSDIEFCVSKRSLFDADEYQEYEEPPVVPKEKIMERINSHKGMKSYQLAQQLSCKWTTGAGPRIGCVRDYPSELQFRVLEELSLSPRKHRCPSPRVVVANLFKETTPRKSPLSSCT